MSRSCATESAVFCTGCESFLLRASARLYKGMGHRAQVPSSVFVHGWSSTSCLVICSTPCAFLLFMFLAVAAKVTRNDPPKMTCARPALGPLRAGHFNYGQQNDPPLTLFRRVTLACQHMQTNINLAWRSVSVCLCLSMSASVCLCLSLSGSVCLCLSLSLSGSGCLWLSMALSVWLWLSLSVCLCLSARSFTSPTLPTLGARLALLARFHLTQDPAMGPWSGRSTVCLNC